MDCIKYTEINLSLFFRLEVVLVKKTTGEFWSNVIPHEKHGVHEIDGEELERISQIHEQMEHLTSDGITRVLFSLSKNFFIQTQTL